MPPVIEIEQLAKTYASGFEALKGVDLAIERGEILALLGPNGAGKTTLISIVCGIVNATAGRVRVDGHDIVRDWRRTRSLIGLVPQELTTNAFETVWDAVAFSRGLFGRPRDDAHLERVLRDLALWERRASKVITLSGGMKRRLMIAKALSHEPRILFLDEPTAGVDVELRRGMWDLVRRLRAQGVTVILTTHYIEEAEELADRIAVIHHGELLLVEEKARLMRQLGRKRLTLQLAAPLAALPGALAATPGLALAEGGRVLRYDHDGTRPGAVAALLDALRAAGVAFDDLRTEESTLEDIFVGLVHAERAR